MSLFIERAGATMKGEAAPSFSGDASTINSAEVSAIARFVRHPTRARAWVGDGQPFKIVNPVRRWQLQMLALFGEDA